MVRLSLCWLAMMFVLGAHADPLADAIAAEEFRQITSVLVARDGDLTYERYFGDGAPAHLNNTRSATKTLVAMAIGAAIADGHIENVDAPVYDFFADDGPFRFDSDTKRAITLRDLLTMTSAYACNDNVWESPGNEEHMHPARRWRYFVLDLPLESDYVRNASGYGPFRYCTAGSFLLGQVIGEATGEPVDRYVESRLFAPLGIEAVNWYRSPSNEVQTGGGTELRSRDLLALGELLRGGGRHGSEQVLPAAWVDDMLTQHTRANERQHYGYQIWHENFACGADSVSGWYFAGNGGNKVVVVDELDLTVVVTATLYGTRGMHQQSTAIIERFVLAAQPECASPST
ncbi:MAG: serine hydrolase [Pseudomonadota bacterium]